MISIRARLGNLRELVAGVFLVGLLSGPLRSCPTHEQHAQHASGSSMAFGAVHGPVHGHGSASYTAGSTAETPADGVQHVGCDCLGLCHIESAPLGFRPSDAELAIDPARSVSYRPTWQEEPGLAPSYAFPLARPPPAVV